MWTVATCHYYDTLLHLALDSRCKGSNIFLSGVCQWWQWQWQQQQQQQQQLFNGLPRWASTRKIKPKTNLDLLEQETSGSGIRWAISKSAPRSRQIIMPAPNHSVFYRPDAPLAAEPTVYMHWRHESVSEWQKIQGSENDSTVSIKRSHKILTICINYPSRPSGQQANIGSPGEKCVITLLCPTAGKGEA